MMSSKTNMLDTFKEWCELNKGKKVKFDKSDDIIFTKEEFEHIYTSLGGNPDEIGWKDGVTHVRLNSLKISEDGSDFNLNYSIGCLIKEKQQEIILNRDEVSITDN